MPSTCLGLCLQSSNEPCKEVCHSTLLREEARGKTRQARPTLPDCVHREVKGQDKKDPSATTQSTPVRVRGHQQCLEGPQQRAILFCHLLGGSPCLLHLPIWGLRLQIPPQRPPEESPRPASESPVLSRSDQGRAVTTPLPGTAQCREPMEELCHPSWTERGPGIPGQGKEDSLSSFLACKWVQRPNYLLHRASSTLV